MYRKLLFFDVDKRLLKMYHNIVIYMTDGTAEHRKGM